MAQALSWPVDTTRIEQLRRMFEIADADCDRCLDTYESDGFLLILD